MQKLHLQVLLFKSQGGDEAAVEKHLWFASYAKCYYEPWLPLRGGHAPSLPPPPPRQPHVALAWSTQQATICCYIQTNK